MDFLSKPEREFLKWLREQEKPVSIKDIKHAPSYSERRLNQLEKIKMIYTPNTGYYDEKLKTYAITDQGLAALETSKRALDSDRRSKIALVVSIIAVVISLAAFVRSFFV